ncbi:hypothetical protein ASPZODRAFT_160314 [Penicilliopsis zonata CBS 506.65]|uniref:Arf-GAP domain-containing protein n=1 Tax=Penicilliopsis zonata CBS 506.65 TaxID=1073090 RepID=A0A1L9SEA7_9EURO|nr:hypothetical protein ASPZODRAFT_160314 [Penicilliopsis zonata CBS 506.65]OJJ45453.1 hypothetical protein ASPZODRAFT_160314 [Penicilliopsis zonata CBS 506.65]
MSRRATPDRAAQNQQTIKTLLKLESNKTCADCKRNKHPRWASWNLGIFICIRCSGIHRGMGTHISRVKSVDLDSWTDEQLQSVVRWGNSRANKYWEAKLAPGHVPSEAKIENFIRTKYESKRWVMDGPMPDPATLDDGDDDVPLAVVQEKAKIERSASQRGGASGLPAAPRRQAPTIDFFGDTETISPPVRPSTTEPAPRAVPKESQPAPKTHRPADSLLGLDFFGSTQPAAPNRPASTTPTGVAGLSRPDLKQSILSLYSKPAPAPAQHERTSSFGDLTSPMPSSAQPQSSSTLGGITDAFSGLTFPSASTTMKPVEKASPFASLATYTSPKSSLAAPKVTSPSPGTSGGGLFDSLTSPNPPVPNPQGRTSSISSNGFSNDLGGFSSFVSPSTTATKPNVPPPSSALSNDLFGFSSPASAPAPVAAAPKSPSISFPQQEIRSAFNLSAPAPAPAPKPAVPATTSVFSSAVMDPWGGNAWNTPEPAAPAAPARSITTTTTATAPTNPSSMMRVPDTLTANDFGAGWGAPSASISKPAATVAEDEDFGGWTSAAPVASTTTTTTTNTSGKAAGGFGGSDDLFSNVWE